ncbi:MAG: DegQ family serine endoprotease [Cellvibrionales bacterium]|nr:DegQ family serine endoprotease [Cellvibrionales bacterium]
MLNPSPLIARLVPSLALLLCTAALIPAAAARPALPDFTEIIQQTSPAVVKINTLSQPSPRMRQFNQEIPPFFRDFFERYPMPQPRPAEGLGSGFIISKDGYIVTNHHVIEDADQIIVRLSDRREYDAELVGSDSRSDLALLKIDERNLPTLEFAAEDDLKVGEWVLAIGSPFGLDYSVSAGIVSAMGRSLPNGSGQDYVPFIQTDVAINPGNSGGPLFNLDGEVVGVNSQIYTRSGGFMGLSFAVPATVAVDIIGQLRSSGAVARGWLGVVIQDVDRDLARSFGLDKPRGALVTRVQKDGPADRAGIRAGDLIIELDGKPIEFSHDLPHIIGLIDPGTRARARLVREKREKELEIEIGALEQTGQTRLASETPSASRKGLGLSVAAAPPAALKELDLDQGVLVRAVEPGSPAARAGLRSGDILVQMAFRDVKTVRGFERILASLEPGDLVPILFYREGTASFRTLRVAD